MEVLQAKYGTVCKIISQKLSLYEISDLTSLLKYVKVTYNRSKHGDTHACVPPARQVSDITARGSGGHCLEREQHSESVPAPSELHCSPKAQGNCESNHWGPSCQCVSLCS